MDMHEALREVQAAQGATLAVGEGAIADLSFPATFGQDDSALAATQTGVALYDRSHWGRILVKDGDRLRFLHNQTTNDFQRRQPGEGCDTVFVTSTARTLDLATAYIRAEDVLLLVSPGQAAPLMAWMDRFIFFADKVALEDATATTVAFSLIGPNSDALIQALGAGDLVGQPLGTHRTYTVAGMAIQIAVGCGVAIAGYTLIATTEQAVPLWQHLTTAGAIPLGETAWEQLRIQQGRPTPSHELTEDYNPLEAGLWHTITLDKGCYIGQETIARLNTYRGVKQQLWGIHLATSVPVGSVVMSGEEKIGTLTSLSPTPAGYQGLAYIRTKAVEAGVTTVQIDGVSGELVPVPFVRHNYMGDAPAK